MFVLQCQKDAEDKEHKYLIFQGVRKDENNTGFVNTWDLPTTVKL